MRSLTTLITLCLVLWIPGVIHASNLFPATTTLCLSLEEGPTDYLLTYPEEPGVDLSGPEECKCVNCSCCQKTSQTPVQKITPSPIQKGAAVELPPMVPKGPAMVTTVRRSTRTRTTQSAQSRSRRTPIRNFFQGFRSRARMNCSGGVCRME